MSSRRRRMPEYIEYGPRETAPPPFEAGSGSFVGLILKGNRTRLKQLCEQVLNAPFREPKAADRRDDDENEYSVTRYEVYSDAVLLFSGDWDGMYSVGMLGSGTADEKTLSMWIPLRAHTKGESKPRNVMMVPYMFVNNPMSLLNGREDYGYQKALGVFSPSGRPANMIEKGFAGTVAAFGGTLAKTSHASWYPLVSVEPVAPSAAARPGEERKIKAPGKSDEPFDLEVLREMLRDGVTQVFLKQFRDVSGAGRACYQALVEADVHFKNVIVKPTLREWHVWINKLAEPNTHPITTELGLLPESDTPFSFTLDASLRLDAGRILARNHV